MPTKVNLIVCEPHHDAAPFSCVERDIAVYDTLTAPHKTPINPDQLLSRYAVGFVEHASNFVVVVLADRIDDAFELITDIQLVCVE